MTFLVHRCEDNREAIWFPAKNSEAVDPDAWLLFREKGRLTLTQIIYCPWCGLALPAPVDETEVVTA